VIQSENRQISVLVYYGTEPISKYGIMYYTWGSIYGSFRVTPAVYWYVTEYISASLQYWIQLLLTKDHPQHQCLPRQEWCGGGASESVFMDL